MKRSATILLPLLLLWCIAPATAGQSGRTTTPETRGKSPAISTISVNGVNDIDPAKAFGSREPALVIEVFSDFQCPLCKELYEKALVRLVDKYVTGATPCKVYIVHRDFTWPYHAYARAAASYSRAAAHIGKCQEVEAALFADQQHWERSGDVRGVVAGVLSAVEMKKVDRLVESRVLDPLIDRDQQLGLALPVRGTPTLVFHTRDGRSYPVMGIASYDALKNFMEQLLRQS